MSEGETKRAKKELLSPEDIARLPIDVRVEVLSRVDRLEDLFALGRQMPMMKAFMKRYDVFGKWFRYHTGLSVDEADDYVKLIVRSFEMDAHGFVNISWGRGYATNHLRVVFIEQIVIFITDVKEIVEMFGKKTTPKESVVIRVPVEEEPMLYLIRILRMIDQKLPEFRDHKSHFVELMNFSHKSPFDLLSLISLSIISNKIPYSADSSRALRLYREVGEDLRNGASTVSQVLYGKFNFRN